MLAQGKPVRRKLRNCPDLVSTDLLINGCESDKLVRVRHFPPAREENYKITDAYCVAYRRPTDTPRYLSRRSCARFERRIIAQIPRPALVQGSAIYRDDQIGHCYIESSSQDELFQVERVWEVHLRFGGYVRS
jgi:hypothetical protein